MFTSNHTGRDPDTMLPLYMLDEMYRKSLLLGHRSMEIGNLTAGSAEISDLSACGVCCTVEVLA